jgi:hypothetical protein
MNSSSIIYWVGDLEFCSRPDVLCCNEKMIEQNSISLAALNYLHFSSEQNIFDLKVNTFMIILW